jgi:TnpA family transposase
MRFWRIDPTANYGVLDGIARSRIDTSLISENWEDMLRVVGSLKLGTVDPVELMRTLQRGGHATTLAKAIGEVGRIAKSLFLLSYIDDETYRRRILIQLNKGKAATAWREKSSMGTKGRSASAIGKGKRSNWAPWGWWSMPSSSGTRSIWTVPWRICSSEA